MYSVRYLAVTHTHIHTHVHRHTHAHTYTHTFIYSEKLIFLSLRVDEYCNNHQSKNISITTKAPPSLRHGNPGFGWHWRSSLWICGAQHHPYNWGLRDLCYRDPETPKGAAGPDKLKPLLLQELRAELAPILKVIFERSIQTVSSLQTGAEPRLVVPIFEKGDKTWAANDRPISLTCILCKFIEHTMASRVV